MGHLSKLKFSTWVFSSYVPGILSHADGIRMMSVRSKEGTTLHNLFPHRTQEDIVGGMRMRMKK